MKPIRVVTVLLALVAGSQSWAATIDDIRFLARIEIYEAIADTTLVTQQGEKIPINRGTKVNVAGFTEAEAFIISRSDRPTGFINKAHLAPAGAPNRLESPRIKEETLHE